MKWDAYLVSGVRLGRLVLVGVEVGGCVWDEVGVVEEREEKGVSCPSDLKKAPMEKTINPARMTTRIRGTGFHPRGAGTGERGGGVVFMRLSFHCPPYLIFIRRRRQWFVDYAFDLFK